MSTREHPQCSQTEERWPELVDLIHPSLSRLNYSDPWTKARVIGVTVVFCFLITVLMHFLFQATSSVYRGLKLKHQIFWNTSAVRGLFGFFCTVVAIWAIFGNTGLEEDIVFATTPTSHLTVCVVVGFFAFENVALTLSDLYFRCFSRLLHLHHWLSLLGFGAAIVTDASHHLGCKSIIIEMSTPFSALCWTMLKAGKERSFLWKANQFLLVHTFHLRSVAECMIWYLSYRNWGNIWANMPSFLFYMLYIQLILVTLVFTPHWTYQKTKQLIIPVDWNFEPDKGAPETYEKIYTAGEEDSTKNDNREMRATDADDSVSAGNRSFVESGTGCGNSHDILITKLATESTNEGVRERLLAKRLENLNVKAQDEEDS